VRAWLESSGLRTLAPLFEEHDIGGDVLLDLTAEDLAEMGVARVGDRKRLLRALEALRARAARREGPRLDVAVLRASPLVQIRRGADPVELESIDFSREQDRLSKVVRDGTDASTRHFETGTFDAFSRILQLGTVLFSLTSYVTPQGRLLLEKNTGEAAEFDVSAVLPDMLGTGGASICAMPVCVILCLCGQGLEEAAHAFLRYGSRHVVLLTRAPRVSTDGFVRVFSAAFVHHLLGGRTVSQSFELASSVAQHPADCQLQGPRAMLLPEDGRRHEVCLFKPPMLRDVANMLPDEFEEEEDDDVESVSSMNFRAPLSSPKADSRIGGQPACSPERNTGADSAAGSAVGSNESSTRTQRSPRPQLRTVGRQLHTWKVILALSKSRCVVVCGVGGVGKAELCRSVVSHLEQRNRWLCERGAHIVRLRGLGTVHAAAAELRHVLDDADVLERNRLSKVDTAGVSVSAEEDWESLAARLGERLLVLTNAEELLNSQARALAQFLAVLLNSGPRLRILLTSRRKVPHDVWPARSNLLPFHIHLSQLDPRASVQLLSDLVPGLDSESGNKIASLCGHLPLPLKLVGQRLAASTDPVNAASEFIAETTQSPEKRASMLFSECIAPYVWRSLDLKRRRVLAALSIFRGSFEPSAAAAVLGMDVEQTKALLQEFQDQCLIERPSEDYHYMPTSVHLLVQQTTAEEVSAASSHTDTASAKSLELKDVCERLVVHVALILKEVARRTASDRGKGKASLDALRFFDKSRGDIDLALDFAGTSDLFALMVQLGRDVFDTRFSAQRRVEIYERLLGILMAARKAPVSHAKAKPAPAPRIAQLLRAFEPKASPEAAPANKLPNLERTRSFPIGPGNYVTAPRTQPTTPLASRHINLSENEGDASPPFSKSLPASPSAFSSRAQPAGISPYSFFTPPLSGNIDDSFKPEKRNSLRRKTHDGHGTDAPDTSLPPTPVHASMSLHAQVPACQTPTGAKTATVMLPPGCVREKPDSRATRPRWPSYIFATSEGSDIVVDQVGDEQDSEENCSDWRGVTSSRPSWCNVLTAAQNAQLRSRSQQIVQDIPMAGSPMAACGGDAERRSPASSSTSPASSQGTPVAAKWGPSSWWHLEPTHDGALIEVLLRLGAAHSALGRFAHAAQLLRKALIRTEEAAQRSWVSSGLSADALKAELLGTLSGVLCQQGLTQESEVMLWQARQLAKQAGHGELYLKLTCDLAEFNRRQKGNMKAAQKLFQVALEMRLKTLGLENIDTASTLNAVGGFAAQKGDFEEARRLITDALQVRLKLLGRSHLSVAEAYHNLAFVRAGSHHFEDAVGLYEEALKVKRRVLPESHMSIADTEHQLSALYTKMKKHEECVRLLRRCLQDASKTVGEMHPSTASVLMNLGHAVHMLASSRKLKAPLSSYLVQLDESQALLERAFRTRKAIFHKRHPSVAECRAYLGYVHFSKQEFDKAENHFSKAIRVYGRQYGRMHPDIATWSFWLGKAQFVRRRFRRGRENLQMALQLSEMLAAHGGAMGQNPLNHENLEEIRGLLGEAPRSPASSAPTSLNLPKTATQSVNQAPSQPEEEPAEELTSVRASDYKQPENFAASSKQRVRPCCLVSPSPSPSPSPSEGESAAMLPVVAKTRRREATSGKCSLGSRSTTPLASPQSASGDMASRTIFRNSPKSSTPLASPQSAGGDRSSRHLSPEPSSSSSSESSTDENATTSGGRGSTYDDSVDGKPPSSSIKRIMRDIRRSTKEYESSHQSLVSPTSLMSVANHGFGQMLTR
jgi:tetratricopeptide (TPR) repeat protein